MNACFLEILVRIIFFLNKNKKIDDDDLFSLKMNKAWANAPSLEHKSMNLEKTWFDQFLKKMMHGMIFENKLVKHIKMSYFD